MAINGDAQRNSTISAASSAQTWDWSRGYQNIFIQNLSPNSITAADTSLLFDEISAVNTSSLTAIELQAGQMLEMHYAAPIQTLTFYSTGLVKYQVIPVA